MIYIDVDTAVTVPANAVALIDDTDFTSREVAIVYNQAGMDLVWNFVTSAGVITQTAVTPTTAGDYDWTHIGDGMYKIEIPASGGASINNDAEGVGYFSGICTGVLAWRSPDIVFRAAALNDALIDGGDNLDTNVVAISGDTTAADNLEATYDGTGYTADTAPATQSQVTAISAASASLVVTADDDNANGTDPLNGVTFVGSATGTRANLDVEDGTLFTIDDTGNAFDLVVQYGVPSNAIPLGVTIAGYLAGGNDAADVQVYDHDGTAWVTKAAWDGKNGTANDSFFVPLGDTKWASSAGLVYVRHVCTGQSNPQLNLDSQTVSYQNQTVGYAMGSIWINGDAANTNTVSFVDGTADNPVSTWAAALSLSSALGLTCFQISGGTSITLTANSDSYCFHGQAYSIALGGKSIDGAFFFGASITGTGTSSGTHPVFEDCPIGDVSLPPSIMRRCFLSGTITNTGTGDWFINHCMSRVAGSGSPVFDFGTAIGDTSLNMRLYSGGIQLESMGDTGTDVASIEGFGNVIEGTCTGGSVTIRGLMTTSSITNIPLRENARIDTLHIYAEVDTALSDYDPPTKAEMDTAHGLLATEAKQDIIDTNVDAIKVVTDATGTTGTGLSAIPWNASWDAEVQSEVIDALTLFGLDHLVVSSVTGTDVTDDSIIAKLVSASATADWDDYTNTSDSMEAINTILNAMPGSVRIDMDASSTKLASILTDTGTTIPATIATVDSNVDAILVDTGTTLPASIATIDSNVDAILVDTGTTIPATIATIDTNVDTLITQLATAYSEPGDAPGVSETMAEKIGYIYAALRNKITVTASSKVFYDDAGSSLWSKTLSDDATTYTEAEGS